MVILVISFSCHIILANETIPFDEYSLRDPFIAPESIEEIDKESKILFDKILSNLEIMGIVIDGNKRYAIINNCIVKEKDIWGELTVDVIEKGYLIIIYRGRKTTLPYSSNKGS